MVHFVREYFFYEHLKKDLFDGLMTGPRKHFVFSDIRCGALA